MVNPKLIALLPDLASFILVVNEGSFTAAAKQLGVTPSALSKLITRLEQALSVKLFERTTRKLIITQAGQKVYDQSIAMVNAVRLTVCLFMPYAIQLGSESKISLRRLQVILLCTLIYVACIYVAFYFVLRVLRGILFITCITWHFTMYYVVIYVACMFIYCFVGFNGLLSCFDLTVVLLCI